MIGTIIGDIVGSRFESSPRYPKRPVQTKNFNLFYANSRFTDDTVLTCATAETVLSNQSQFMSCQFAAAYKKWGTNYPDRGYGGGFRNWLTMPVSICNKSFANGAMMRCSPIGMYYNQFNDALRAAEDSVIYTHNSPESFRGVKSIVSAIYMARNGHTKEEIKAYVEENYGHMLDMTLEQARAIPKTSIRCNLSAPQALVCFMESTDYESAIRNAIYLGGDTDTNAAIAGSIAEAFYGTASIPKKLIDKAKLRLNPEIINLVTLFYYTIGIDNPLK